MTQPIRQRGNLLYRFDTQQEWLGESQLYSQILENAQAALNLRHVALSLYDHSTDCYRTVLSVIRESLGLRLMKWLSNDSRAGEGKSFLPRTLSNPLPIDLNPLTYQVYRQGLTVRSTLARYGKGAAPAAGAVGSGSHRPSGAYGGGAAQDPTARGGAGAGFAGFLAGAAL